LRYYNQKRTKTIKTKLAKQEMKQETLKI